MMNYEKIVPKLLTKAYSVIPVIEITTFASAPMVW